MSLAHDSVLRSKATLTVEDLGSELLLRESDAGRVHVLNRTAREVFLALDGKRSVGEVAGELGRRYGRDLSADVLRLAGSLDELGLVDVCA